MVATKTVKITPNISVGAGQKLLIIAGPCQIESKEHSYKIAHELTKIVEGLPISLVFKASYDKANRTSLKGKRGIGIQEGLEVLKYIKESLGIPVLTDVHSPEDAKAAASVVDVVQTPAFLCRQTDLLIAAGQTGKTVNVKKGQFLAPEDMAYVAEKVASSGNQNILLCERGSSFGYRDLIVDMRSIVTMRETGYPVIFDATHSVQKPGASGGASGGSREFVEPLIRAATAVGVDGLFIECHDNPDSAPSDGATMLPLKLMRSVLGTACKIREASK